MLGRMMSDTAQLYASILGLTDQWLVTDVEVDPKAGEVTVFVAAAAEAELPCPDCGRPCSRHDHRTRRWRHLDTCQYRTTVVAAIPRVRCETHGVRQVTVPWGEPGSRFTSLFEAVAIDWLKEASISAVARRMRLTWNQVDRIMQRAVRRGLLRRELDPPRRIGVDETSFQKRHEYVTVVTDLDTSDVLYVADDRSKASLDGFFDEYDPAELTSLEVIAMDMWAPYIEATRESIYRADEKIAFDKFHVAKHLGDAVDKVRRAENRALIEEGDRTLVGTKYTWLQNPENMKAPTTTGLQRLRRLVLKTARAWAIKEHAMCLWRYVHRGWARRAWLSWIGWAIRSRLDPVKRVARMVRDHLEGILNAIVLRATNAASESINSKIQRVKRMACGFRSRQRFRNAIYFHLGGLDLSPLTHTKR